MGGKIRILVTEIGSPSSGDEAICIAAANRLTKMGADVTFCYRVDISTSLKRAGLMIRNVHMPIEERFDDASDIKRLITAFANRLPDLHKRLTRLLGEHDMVMVAPGGKFTEGFNVPRTLLTAATAISMNIPVVILHQSVGPIDNINHRSLLKEVFSRSTLCLIRDDKSLGFLFDIGVPPDRLLRCRDVAMAENYPPPEDPEYHLGINIRCGFTGHVNLDVLSRFIRRYKREHPDNKVLVYSTTWNLPENVVDHLSSLPCEVNKKMPFFPNYLKDIGRCAVNISDSLHGVIFSMMANRPVICCQTGLRTWKLEGIHKPGQEPLRIFPGFVTEKDANSIIDYLMNVEDDPEPLLKQQQQIIEYGKTLCEKGWSAIESLISSSKNQ